MRFDSIWMAAILVVSINTGAYMAESVRGGIISIDPGQTEGAKAIGMTHVRTMLHVILPICEEGTPEQVFGNPQKQETQDFPPGSARIESVFPVPGGCASGNFLSLLRPPLVLVEKSV